MVALGVAHVTVSVADTAKTVCVGSTSGVATLGKTVKVCFVTADGAKWVFMATADKVALVVKTKLLPCSTSAEGPSLGVVLSKV
jgi:hypothetical protein